MLHNYAELDNEIRALGLEPPEHYKSGNTRLRRADKPKKDGNLWLSDNLEVAHITNHSTGDQSKWNATTGTDYNAADRAEQARIRAANAKAAKTKQAAKNARAAAQAAQIMGESIPGVNHRYAKNKGTASPYRTHGNNIVIPAYRDGKLVTVQTITPEGEKKFIYGGSTSGITHQIGRDSETEVVAEGWATGERIHQVTGLTVVIVFSAGQMAKYKKPAHCTTLLIATDNDKSRAGEDAANKLQQRYPGAVSILPPTIGTDWADYTADEVRHYWAEHLPTNTIVSQEYLSHDFYDQAQHVAIRSETGTGKSYSMNRWLRRALKANPKLRVLYVVNSVALAANVTAELGNLKFTSYQDVEFYEGERRLVCCLDSVSKLEACRYDVTIMDECQQDVKALIKRKFTHDRITTAGVLTMLLGKASKTIWLDADAGSLTSLMAKQAGIDNLHWIHNDYQPLEGATVDIYNDLDRVMGIYEADQKQKYMFASSRTEAESISKRHDSILVTSTTVDTEVVRNLLENIRSEEMMTANIIATATLGTGVSIEKHKHNIETVYLVLKLGDSLPDMLTVFQSARRARGVMKFVVYMPNWNPEPRSTNPQNIIEWHLEKQRKQSDDYLKDLTRVDLAGRGFDPLLAGIFGQAMADRNTQANNPLEFLIKRFERAGATVKVHKSSDTEKVSPARQAIKKSRDEIKKGRVALCQTDELPTLEQHKRGIRNPVKKALGRARHDLNLSEVEARKAATREIEKPGYIGRVMWGRRATESEETLGQRDIKQAQNNDDLDPIIKPEAYRAKLEQDVLQLSGVLNQQWFCNETIEGSIRDWLSQNSERYAIATGTTDTGKRSAGFVVGVLERMGITVDRSKRQHQRYYRISTNDEPSRVCIERLQSKLAGQISITTNKYPEFVQAA